MAPFSCLEAACAAPSADNSQPWRFTWDSAVLAVGPSIPGGQAKTFGPDDPATLLSVGGVLENLVRAADFFGVEARIEGPCASREAGGAWFRAALGAASGEPPNPADCPVLGRHTNRFRYRSDPVPVALLQPVSAAMEGKARAAFHIGPPSLGTLAQLVTAASRIRFQTRDVHEWLAASLRFTEEEVARGDGLDVRSLDLPPGGAAFLKFIAPWRRMAALNRIGAYKAMAAIEAQPIRRGPAIVAIIGPHDYRSCMDAGRLMTRIWTDLNVKGLAVHPYYVVADQLQRLREGTVPAHCVEQAEELAEQCRRFFELGPDETLPMLMRVGYPTRGAPRSRRLPLEQVVTDLTGELFPKRG